MADLINATKQQNIENVEVLLNEGVDVNSVVNGETALYIASIAGNVEIVKLLLDKGANIDILNNDGYSSLFYASKQKHVEVVRLLLERGAKIDSDDNKYTALHVACQVGDVEIVKLLLDKGADIDKLGDGKYTPLYIASSRGHVPIVQLLISKNVTIDKLNENGITALYGAVQGGHIKVVEILLEAGADINKLYETIGSVLHVAAGNDNVEMVKLLLDKGANINLHAPGERSVLQLIDHYTKKIKELILDKSPKYTGELRSNIDKFNIFLAIPDYPSDATDEQKVEAENTARKYADNMSLCPVCLSFTERSTGCLYMHHTCEPFNRHTELYNKYKDTTGEIWWCTDCGRICAGHAHYALGYSGGYKPNLLPSEDPFARTCISNGGGSIVEKLRRIARMIDFYADLQIAVNLGEKISIVEVRNMIIEETWNGAMIRTFVNPQTSKRWKTDLSIFPNTVSATLQEPLIIAEGSYETPVTVKDTYCLTDIPDIDEKNKTAIQFKHRNNRGIMFNHVYPDKNAFICKEELITFLSTMGEKIGRCFDDDCGGYLYPPEVRSAFELFGEISSDEEVLLKAYESRFPRMRGGGERLPDLNYFINKMKKYKCYVRTEKGGRKTYKKKMNKRIRPTRKTTMHVEKTY